MKNKFIWLSDLHLPFLGDVGARKFFEKVMERKPLGVFFSGDLSDARNLEKHLGMLAAGLPVPIYFVLGNHDFYHGAFAAVEAKVRCVCREYSNLHYLKEEGIVSMTPQTALIGHDSWADGRAGDGIRSLVQLNDFMLIRDLVHVDDHADLFKKLAARGDECVEHLRIYLPKALETHQQVIVVLHVPPFPDAARYQGNPSQPDYLPHFCCMAAGVAIIEIAQKHPDREVLVLCGHTHCAWEGQILSNVRVRVQGSDYNSPIVEEVEFP